MDDLTDELTEILRRVRAAKELLQSRSMWDEANKELEVVANRLQELIHPQA